MELTRKQQNIANALISDFKPEVKLTRVHMEHIETTAILWQGILIWQRSCIGLLWLCAMVRFR